VSAQGQQLFEGKDAWFFCLFVHLFVFVLEIELRVLARQLLYHLSHIPSPRDAVLLIMVFLESVAVPGT
jgi:hypothetical protein